MRKILSLVLVVLAVNSFGINPSSNSRNTGSYGKNNRNKRGDIDIDIYNIKEKVQIVNISELEGKTFIIEGKAYIIPQNNILYVGRVNSQGRIDLEKELKFKKLDDNCITVDRGKTCFTVRSSTMLPELIRVSDGKTISIGYWKNKKFHNFLLNWKNQ